MTLTTVNNIEISLGDGITKIFGVPFRFFAEGDLFVFLADTDGNDGEPLVLNVDYTVSGAGAPGGGSVTFAVAPPAGRKVVCQRDVVPLQTAEFEENNGFPAATNELVLDRVTAAAQDTKAQARRVALFPRADGGAPGPVPGKAARAGRVATYDGDGNPSVSDLTLAEMEAPVEEAHEWADAAEASKDAAAVILGLTTAQQEVATNKAAEAGVYAAQAAVSGGVGFLAIPNTPNGLSVKIQPGRVFSAPNLGYAGVQTVAGFTAPVGNPRTDRIVLDRLTGAASRVAGTPAAVPVPPAIPAGSVPCAQILMSPGQASIGPAHVFDERQLNSMGLGNMSVVAAAAGLGFDANGNLQSVLQVVPVGGNLPVASVYNAKFLRFFISGGTKACVFDPAATLGAGFYVFVLNDPASTSDLAISSSGGENFAGVGRNQPGFALKPGQCALVESSGAIFYVPFITSVAASAAQARGRAETGVYLTPASLAALVYESPPIAVTAGGTGTLTHGLGVAPSKIRTFLVCVTAQVGFVPGDKFEVWPISTNNNILTWVPAGSVTQIKYIVGSNGLGAYNLANGNIASLTPANFNMIFQAEP